MNETLSLYLTFLKIGAVNFGGGYAMLPLLERDLVENRGWTTTEDLTDYFAIGQCTPGLIALNVATFIGSRRKGIPGAIAATTGFVTIPIIIILLIATFLQGFADLPVVQNAFAGIRVCVCVLIVQAVLRLWNKSVIDKTSLVLYLTVFLLTALSGVLPLAVPAAVLVIISGAFGVILGKAVPEPVKAAESGSSDSGVSGSDKKSSGPASESSMSGGPVPADTNAGTASGSEAVPSDKGGPPK